MSKTIMILVANGFDEVDFTEAQRAFGAEGLKAKVVSVENGLVNSWRDNSWGHHFPSDANVSTALGADYDCLFVPGGTRSITKLSENPHTKRILRSFIDAQKPVALQGQATDLLALCERENAPIVSGAGLTKNEKFITDMLNTFAQGFVELSVACLLYTSDAADE